MKSTIYRCLNVLSVILVLAAFSNVSSIPAEEASNSGTSSTPDTKNLVRLILPPVIFAVPGLESNIYFDNVCLVLSPDHYVFDVQCGKGKQQRERWTHVPAEADMGDHRLTITVRDQQNHVVANATTTVRVGVLNANEGQAFSLLCIGDSLTHASIYPERILERCATPGNPQLELVGSHWVTPEPGKVRHEGYGGWTALRFATHFTETARQGDYGKRGSPFLFAQPDGKPKLDFQKYCQEVNQGKFPTHVTIFLGPNDIFSFDDESIEMGIETMLKHYDQLVEMIRQASPSTRIGIMLPVPPAATQDAFGSNYAAGQTRWQYKRNQHRLVECMQSRYGNRESERIDVLATHVNLDCVHNYPTEQVVANARTTEMIVRQNNGVHPAASGYGQIADSVYTWLKASQKSPLAN